MAALQDIAAGRGVRRADHDLLDHNAQPCVRQFRAALLAEGFREITVADSDVAEEKRVPAWLIEHTRARFGYIFWERFARGRARKLWGSVHKNTKGDWDRMLGARSRIPLYANPDARETVDPENPSGW